MRNLTRYLLWAYVATVPWDNVVVLPLVGTVSRAFGLAVFGATVLTIAANGRVRRPDAVLGFVIAFAVWSVLSLLWTLSYEYSVGIAATFVQCAASVWVIRELVRTRDEVEPLLEALLFGLLVPLVSTLNNFRLSDGTEPQRFSGVGLNGNLVGLLVVLGVPIALHLVMQRRGIVRVAALIYVATAPVALMLTATRGAMVAGLAGFSIVAPTLFRQSSLRSYALAGVLLMFLIVGLLAAVQIVPQYNLDRMGSTVSEVAGEEDTTKTLTGRMQLWSFGLQAFPQRPLLGAGAGAYGAAVEPYFSSGGRPINPHNFAIGLLVEQGIVGLTLFAGIFGACAWTLFRSPQPYRTLWCALLVTWLVDGMTGSPEGQKITWVLFGLVSSQSGLAKTVTGLARQPRQNRSGSNATGTMQHGPNAAGAAPQAARI